MLNKKLFLAQHISVIKNYHVLLDPSDWTTRHVSEQSSHLDILCLLSVTLIGPITVQITCDLLFWIDHHLLHPIWWRHFTLGKYVCRDSSFLLLNLTICLRRRCYRRFFFIKYDTVLMSCTFRRSVFRQHVVDSVFGHTRFRIWYVDRVDE